MVLVSCDRITQLFVSYHEARKPWNELYSKIRWTSESETAELDRACNMGFRCSWFAYFASNDWSIAGPRCWITFISTSSGTAPFRWTCRSAFGTDRKNDTKETAECDSCCIYNCCVRMQRKKEKEEKRTKKIIRFMNEIYKRVQDIITNSKKPQTEQIIQCIRYEDCFVIFFSFFVNHRQCLVCVGDPIETLTGLSLVVTATASNMQYLKEKIKYINQWISRYQKNEFCVFFFFFFPSFQIVTYYFNGFFYRIKMKRQQ